MKRLKIFIILLTVSLLPMHALSADLETAISELPDDALVDLYMLTSLEMLSRGILPEKVEQRAKTIVQSESSNPEMVVDPGVSVFGGMESYLYAIVDLLKNRIAQGAYSETITTYEPSLMQIPKYKPGDLLSDEDFVWKSKTGNKFHTVSDCSGMTDPILVKYSDALSSADACDNCAWWLGSQVE